MTNSSSYNSSPKFDLKAETMTFYMPLFFFSTPFQYFIFLKQCSPVTDINVCVSLKPVKFCISMISYGKEFHRPVMHSIILIPFNVPIPIMLKKEICFTSTQYSPSPFHLSFRCSLPGTGREFQNLYKSSKTGSPSFRLWSCELSAVTVVVLKGLSGLQGNT